MVIAAMLGPYRLLEKIGEGGMGEVYRARDTELNREVALKVLPHLFTSHERPGAPVRFEREARMHGVRARPEVNDPVLARLVGDDGPDFLNQHRACGFHRRARDHAA